MEIELGKQYNKLTVISFSHADKHKKHHYICQCSCGNQTNVAASKILTGKTKGCQRCKCNKTDNHKWTGYEGISGTVWSDISGNNRKRSKKRANMVFSITIKEVWELFVAQEGKCALTGQVITLPLSSTTRAKATASLDRIDSSIGYITGNIQWVHKDINRIKSDFNEKRFIELCKLVAKHNE